MDTSGPLWGSPMRITVAFVFVLAAGSLAACAGGSVRTGPYVDTVAPAPFLTHAGEYPTQNEAQAAVEAAVKRDGYRAVFPAFGAISPDRMPTYFTMFACGPGGSWPRTMTGHDVEVVTCHTDVMDQSYGLLGRATMNFTHGRARGWRLASERDREFDAR